MLEGKSLDPAESGERRKTGRCLHGGSSCLSQAPGSQDRPRWQTLSPAPWVSPLPLPAVPTPPMALLNAPERQRRSTSPTAGTPRRTWLHPGWEAEGVRGGRARVKKTLGSSRERGLQHHALRPAQRSGPLRGEGEPQSCSHLPPSGRRLPPPGRTEASTVASPTKPSRSRRAGGVGGKSNSPPGKFPARPPSFHSSLPPSISASIGLCIHR